MYRKHNAIYKQWLYQGLDSKESNKTASYEHPMNGVIFKLYNELMHFSNTAL